MTYVDRLLTTTPSSGDAYAAASRTGPIDTGMPELAPLLSVLFLMIDETRSIVVNVTSPHSGAGTSTVARKLAEAAAMTGWCRAALIDARPDGPKPDGEAAGLGLADALEGGGSIALTRRRIGALEIDTGQLCTTGRPLTRLESVRRVCASLRDRYSLIIVDCPAVFASQQTLMVAAAADETVLVVEAERTALADVARARAALEQRGASVLGMVMNKSRSRVPAFLGGRA